MTGAIVEYASLLDEIKARICRAQTRAVSAANREARSPKGPTPLALLADAENETLAKSCGRWLECCRGLTRAKTGGPLGWQVATRAGR